MLITHTSAARLAAATLGSAVLLTGFAAAPAFAIDNKGSVTTQAHGCDVTVELRGYGGVTPGGDDVTIAFATEGGQTAGETVDSEPTKPITVTENKSGNDLNAAQKYRLLPRKGQIVDQVKVTAYFGTGEIGSNTFKVNCTADGQDTGADHENGKDNGEDRGHGYEKGHGHHKGHPTKVDSGGEADGSGLIFLGVAGAGLLGAAGYGLTRSRRKK